MANPKAARSLIIYILCGSELIVCLVIKQAIPEEFLKEELIAGDEKFEISLIVGLPIINVPPGRKSWPAADLLYHQPSKHSASEMCEDQIIVVMMKWLSCCACRHENIHTACN